MGDPRDRIGSIVARSYRLERVLGEGGMGTVYEATHTRVPRKFAVKVLKPECAADRDLFERFRREAEIASSIGHEHIAEALDFDILEDGAPYIILEFLEGEHLGTRIGRRQRLSVDETAQIIEDTASALQAAHERGIVHRDLKPQNLFLIRRGKRDDFVKVLDFGISKVLHDASLSTREGSYLGTPNYMAPEQLAAEHGPIDARTDIWALATIAYECLTGRLAFSGPTVSGTFFQVVHGQPLPLRTISPGVSETVEKVIMRGLAKSPNERYASAKDFADALLVAVGRPPSVGRMPTASFGLTPLPQRPADIGLEPTLASGLPAIPPRPDTLQSSSRAIEIPRPRRAPLVAVALVVAVAAGGLVLLRARTSPTSPPPTTAAPTETTTASVVAPASSPTMSAAPSAPAEAASAAPSVSTSTTTAKPLVAKPAKSAPAPTTKPASGGIDIGPREKDL